MPGLIGAVFGSKRDRERNRLVMGRMGDLMRHHPDFQVDQHAEEAFALGRVGLPIFNSAPQPVCDRSKGLFLMLDGEILNGRDLVNTLDGEAVGTESFSEPELILRLYQQYGADCVQRLKGIFTVAVYDAVRQELVLFNDRFGVRNLYYHYDPHRIVFASEIKALLQVEGVDRAVDEEAVMDFLNFSYPLGDKTFFSRIRLFPPGSIGRYRGGEWSIRRYWEMQHPEEYGSPKLEDYLEEGVALMRSAVGRQFKAGQKIGMTLSGGLDSRAILAAVGCSNGPIKTVTYGVEGCRDQYLAERIARACGSDHHFIQLQPDSLVDYGLYGIWLTDGHANISHFHSISVLDEIKRHFDCNLDGYIGGATLGGHFIQQDDLSVGSISDNLLRSLFRALNPRFHPELQNILFEGSFRERWARSTMVSLEKEISTLNSRQYADKKDILILLNRSRRFISMVNFGIKATHLEGKFPFCDYDLFDYYLKVPPQLRYNSRLYRKIIGRLNTGLIAVPWQQTGLPLDRDLSSDVRLFGQSIARIIYLLRRFTHGIIDIRSKRSFYHYNQWFRHNKRLRDFFTAVLLDPRTENRGFLKPGGVQQLIQLQMNGRNHFDRIGLLFTLEMWFRFFVDGDPPPEPQIRP